ncbi:MAG: mechanosensitive ion channel [Symploca sp. SIO2G7]|nr:mechanosensitive ion channel [Symploca sp. SIO2G7]
MAEQLIELLKLGADAQTFWLSLAARLSALLLCVFLAFLLGQWAPTLVKWVLKRTFPPRVLGAYDQFMSPVRPPLIWTGRLLLVAISLEFLRVYPGFYKFLQFFVYLSLTICAAALTSRLMKQIVLLYGLVLVRRLGRELGDIVLVFETIANLIIGFFAVVLFARSQGFQLIAVLLGFGLSGVAVAFAAQEVLSQLFGTLVLYLDRPYTTGEYIRVNLNQLDEDVYGRVEGVGIRSTRIRSVAKNTLIIVPNSVMVAKKIVNVTRGKKVMVLLYFNFSRSLQVNDQALVEQVIEESTEQLFGVDPSSTRMEFFQLDDLPGTRVRLSFFIVGSNENSLELSKRLAQISQKAISKRLEKHNLHFVLEEPTLYVDSPITL